VIAVFAVAGIVGILYLAISGAMQHQMTGLAKPDGAVPDAVASSTPSNNTQNPDTSFLGDTAVTIVASDQDTWPGGDAIWDVARAIAVAEGYGEPGVAPTNLNNPGDISDGADQFGSEHHSGSNVTHFPDATTGWNWLYNKLKNVKDGKSKVYNNDMTWTTFAQTWAGNWQAWCNNVTRELGVATTDRVGDYWNA
jgi:hypothetical protein